MNLTSILIKYFCTSFLLSLIVILLLFNVFYIIISRVSPFHAFLLSIHRSTWLKYGGSYIKLFDLSYASLAMAPTICIYF